MVVSRNVRKKPKKSTKTVGGAVKKNVKLKSNVKSQTIKKTTKTAENVIPKSVKMTEKLKNKRNSKAIDVNSKENTDINTEKTITQKSKKNKTKKSQGNTIAANHVGAKQREVQTVINNKKKNTVISKPTLKRNRGSAKEKGGEKTTAKAVPRKKQKLLPVVEASTETWKVQTRQKTSIETDKENSDMIHSKDLSREHILQCITAIFHLTEEQLKSKNALFDGESHPIFMQVTCIRVPKTPRRQMRILLPHTIVAPNDDVALFVCDLQRGRRKDYEPTVEHYQELLEKHGCTSIKSVIPMNQVKTEYDQYELKRKLVSSYDHFLVDGRIAGHMSHLLGNEFYRKRKLPTSVKMQSKDLKHEIEYALRKTSMQLHSDGDTHIIQIGHTSMKEEDILENILSACSFLSINYPGGWNNIRSIRIKTATSLALPIYVTLKNKNTVNIPVVSPRRPRAYRNIEDELSTLEDAKVTVTPEGDVIVKENEHAEEKDEESESDV